MISQLYCNKKKNIFLGHSTKDEFKKESNTCQMLVYYQRRIFIISWKAIKILIPFPKKYVTR